MGANGSGSSRGWQSRLPRSGPSSGRGLREPNILLLECCDGWLPPGREQSQAPGRSKTLYTFTQEVTWSHWCHKRLTRASLHPIVREIMGAGAMAQWAKPTPHGLIKSWLLHLRARSLLIYLARQPRCLGLVPMWDTWIGFQASGFQPNHLGNKPRTLQELAKLSSSSSFFFKGRLLMRFKNA